MIMDTVNIFFRIIKIGGLVILGIVIGCTALAFYTALPVFLIMRVIKESADMPVLGNVIVWVSLVSVYLFTAIIATQLFCKFFAWIESMDMDLLYPGYNDDESEQDRDLRLYTTSSTYTPPNDEPVEIKSSPNGVIEVLEKEKGTNILSDIPQKRRLII